MWVGQSSPHFSTCMYICKFNKKVSVINLKKKGGTFVFLVCFYLYFFFQDFGYVCLFQDAQTFNLPNMEFFTIFT